jgi:uncharacterized protein (DUF1697 family)
MTSWVALIRAINGAPANRLKMVDLAAMLTCAGCADVTWHIQTGNMFFAAGGDRDDIAEAIEATLVSRGLVGASVMLRTADELGALVARRPFAGVDLEHFSCEASFLRHPPTQRVMERLDALGCVIAHADDTVVCSWFPRRGKLIGSANGVIEKQWKVVATGRSWKVVEEVAAKALERQ